MAPSGGFFPREFQGRQRRIGITVFPRSAMAPAAETNAGALAIWSSTGERGEIVEDQTIVHAGNHSNRRQ